MAFMLKKSIMIQNKELKIRPRAAADKILENTKQGWNFIDIDNRPNGDTELYFEKPEERSQNVKS